MEYEEHLRNTLKKGMDAESYSLHTFEALLTQSMENLGNSKPAWSPTFLVNFTVAVCTSEIDQIPNSNFL